MPRYPHPLVVFDLDGTLVDSLPVTVECFRQTVAPYLGRTPSRDEVVARFGPPDHQLVADWVGPAAAKEAVARLYAEYERILRDLQPIPGVLDLLEELHAVGRRIGLFTGRGRPSTRIVLEAAGLEPWIEFSVTGDEVPRSKPAPDGLLAVAAAAGLPPADLVYVGDSPLDVAAAAAAGAGFLGAAWANGIEPITHPGTTVALSLGDLWEFLLGR